MWLSDLWGYLPTWLWALVAFLALLYTYGIWPYLTSDIDLPGPKPSPFVGNILQVRKKGMLQADCEFLKRYGDVFVTWNGPTPVICVANPVIIREVFVKDFANFTNRPANVPLSPVQKAMVTSLEDDHWKFVRSIMTPAFSSGKMRRMLPMIQTCLNRMMENIEGYAKTGESFETKLVMGGLAMEVIGAVGFGIDTDVQKDLNSQFLHMAKRLFDRSRYGKIHVLFSLFFPFLIRPFEMLGLTADNKDANDFFRNLLTKTIKERRQNPSNRKDLLQLMLDSSLDDLKDASEDGDVDTNSLKLDNINREKKLSEEEVIAQTILFLFAGFDTTSSALSFLAYNLALNPDCQDRLIEEIDEKLKGASPTYDNVNTLPYLDMCLAESQRIYPVVRGTMRVAENTTVIQGVRIPAKTTVMLAGYAVQHDPRYWPEPETFDPQRFSPEEKAKRNPYVYFPFGLGPRNCVGMRLALMEAKMAMVSILQKFRFVRSPDTEVPLTLMKSPLVKAEKGVWLKVVPRV